MFHAVSPAYFSTMGIALLRGRFFTDADSDRAPGVAIVNRNMAQRYWPEEDPIGQAVLASRGIVVEISCDAGATYRRYGGPVRAAHDQCAIFLADVMAFLS